MFTYAERAMQRHDVLGNSGSRLSIDYIRAASWRENIS